MPAASPLDRALTARSAILSVLLGAHPAEATARSIVRVGTALGLQESAVRAALTRMVGAGDLERSDATYRLSERLAERQRRQDAAVSPSPRPWQGQWVLALVTVGATDSTDRAAFRETLRQARFGELREGVWGRPDNIALSLPDAARDRLTLFHGRPEEPSNALADRLFEPARWAARADELLATFAGAGTLTARFEVAAAMVRHILDDPVLPDELLPADWPGTAMRTAYAGFRSEFYDFAVEHLGERPPQIL